MKERVILADCCEDWIIEWGGHYPAGRAFTCPECATQWTKQGPGRFRRADAREFERRERKGPSSSATRAGRDPGPEAAFPYLAAADGDEPDVERCCAKILLAHGQRLADGAFTCPACGTEWERSTQRLHGLRIPVFSRSGLREPLTIQQGRDRPFLVAVTEYSPPRD